MPLKLVMFDLDGTLVNTVQDITDALNYALKPYGIKRLTVGETMNMVGEGVSRLIEKALPIEKGHLKDDVIKRFLEDYSEHLIDKSREYPHVKETLENLIDFKKAIISNKREDLSRRVIEKLGLSEYFDLIIGSDTAGERKPSAVPVLYVISKLGVSPEESIIVGDSNFDIEAGKKAGIKTIAVTYGYRPREFLTGADYIIDDIRELIPLLREIDKTK
jgi:phosphoglycolate phosphatase